jgi:hypothetical protein
MALSVLKPGSAIHPMVGSIFSTTKPRVSFESLGEVENAPIGDRHDLLREAISTAATSSPLMSDSRAATHDVKEARPASPTVAMPSGAVSAQPYPHRPDTQRPGSLQPNANAPDDRRPESSGNVAASEATPVKRTLTPLIAAALAPGPQPVTLRSAAKPNADAAQSFASRSRATDDIEIHIGRIEVAAMQAAPIRSAPDKPPRRATSLDEYLKRRDGSAS